MEIYKNKEVHIYTDENGRIVTDYSSLWKPEEIPKSKSIDVSEGNGRYWGYVSAENIDELIDYLTKQLKNAKSLKTKTGAKMKKIAKIPKSVTIK